jgi:hypothetical protein
MLKRWKKLKFPNEIKIIIKKDNKIEKNQCEILKRDYNKIFFQFDEKIRVKKDCGSANFATFWIFECEIRQVNNNNEKQHKIY